MSIRISFIIPLFGNKKEYYVKEKYKQIVVNAKLIKKKNYIELIFVDDDPSGMHLSFIEDLDREWINLTLIKHKKNQGIHQSRVDGLNIARGSYVVFLDQDDDITSNYIKTQLQNISKADMVVGNGILEEKHQQRYLYRWKFYQLTVKHLIFYSLLGCRIISPGQCLIRKESIPLEWKQNIMKKNGSDDFFLWILFITMKKKIVINREVIYIHRYTGENFSLDDNKMQKSAIDLLTQLSNTNLYSDRQYRKLEKVVFRTSMKKGVFIQLWKGLIISLGTLINVIHPPKHNFNRKGFNDLRSHI